MSDLDLVRLLDELERLLDQGEVEGEVLADWRPRFEAALATAERGPGWPETVARAHALGRRLDLEADRLSVERDRIRQELDLQGHGSRALKGYRPG